MADNYPINRETPSTGLRRAVEISPGIFEDVVRVSNPGGASKVSVANTPAIITAAGDILVANASRNLFSIHNTGTNPIFLRLGTAASTTVHHVVIPGGVVNDDGTGGHYERSEYTGIVSIAGTSIRCVVLEL